MKATKNGFTIVELLIVIVVIAILAAITIVAFNGIQAKAHDAAVRSDLSALAKKLQIYKIDNGNYPYGSDPFNTGQALAAGISFKASKGSYSSAQSGNLLYITDIGASTGTKYVLMAVPTQGTAIMVSSDNSSPRPYVSATAPFPGSGYGQIAQQLGYDSLASGNTVTYNAYSPSGFRIWD